MGTFWRRAESTLAAEVVLDSRQRHPRGRGCLATPNSLHSQKGGGELRLLLPEPLVLLDEFLRLLRLGSITMPVNLTHEVAIQ